MQSIGNVPDIDTTYRLELLSPMSSANTSKDDRTSLYAMLNYCTTGIGKRTLRARILEPMCDLAEIGLIHECIKELAHVDVNLSHMLHTMLNDFNTVDRLCKLTMVVPQDTSIRLAEILINRTVQMKKCLQMVPQLQTALAHFDSKLLRDIHDSLNDVRYRSMLEHIEKTVNKDVGFYGGGARSLLLQRIHCVQDGVSELLDFSRKLYKDLIGEVKGGQLMDDTRIQSKSKRTREMYRIQGTPRCAISGQLNLI